MMMEVLPDLKVKVIYPKGCKISKTTLFHLRIYKVEEDLVRKVGNEFKHCLLHYNPYNFMDEGLAIRYVGHLDDYNNYDCFQGAKNELQMYGRHD